MMKTTQKDYDYTPLPARRIFTNFLRWKAMPFGYIERGPGIVWLITIWLRHRLGFQLATLKLKHTKQFDRAVFILDRIKGLLHR